MGDLPEATIADYQTAYKRRHLKGWEELEAQAHVIAYERRLEENMREQSELCERMKTLTGAAWWAVQKRFDELMAEHDALLDAAFPRGTKDG